MRANGEKPEEKALQCRDQSSVSRSVEASWNYTSGCLIGGWNFAKDTFESIVGIGTAIGEGAAQIVIDHENEKAVNAACDADPNGKTSLFKQYNSAMPKLLQITPPADAVLAKTNCATVKSVMKLQQATKSNEAMAKLGRRMSQKTPNYTADEQEYMEWGKGQVGSTVDLVALSKEKLKEMGVKLECYNSQEAAAMVCEGIANVATLAAGPAGAALKAAKLKNISKIAGVALETEKVAGTANAARTVASAADLEKAAKLSNIERISAAEQSLGRTLSAAEQKALIEAHEVAAGTGRGYGTYSATDLKLKSDLLKKAGFSEAERDALLRQGLAGSLSNTQVARNAANTLRLNADKMRVAGDIPAAKNTYRSAADSLEVVMKDSKAAISERDYRVAAGINANAERYDKAADYFLKSFSAERDSSKKATAIYETLKREKDELRVIAYKNSSNASTQFNYENQRKLIEAVLNNPQFKLSDAYKRELLKP